jgi:hypothetical protein
MKCSATNRTRNKNRAKPTATILPTTQLQANAHAESQKKQPISALLHGLETGNKRPHQSSTVGCKKFSHPPLASHTSLYYFGTLLSRCFLHAFFTITIIIISSRMPPIRKRGKDLSPQLRSRICELRSIGYSYNRIHSIHRNIPLSTIISICRLEASRQDNCSKPRSGAHESLRKRYAITFTISLPIKTPILRCETFSTSVMELLRRVYYRL